MGSKEKTAWGLLAPREEAQGGGKRGTFADYLAIARFDHATKHVFIVPGMALAYQLRGVRVESLAANAVLGLVMAICVASANYAIDEWLDRDFDRYHPEKCKRSAVQRELLGPVVLAEWLALLGVGLGCGLAASKTLFFAGCIFALQGVVYNVPPLRTKDEAYLDVISESVNNPLRLTIGWAIVDPATLPPSSVILAFWLGGAFLMAAKRLSEYRELFVLHGKEMLVRYRASFAS
ncbi:MAG: UbiA family prenyltransferase, partial [Rhodomicrobium sp.]